MIYACPFCGRRLLRVICKEGISTCTHCHRVFDTSSYHKILSAAWMVRLMDLYDPEAVQASFELTDCEMGIVKKYVIDEGLCHDDLLRVVGRWVCDCQT